MPLLALDAGQSGIKLAAPELGFAARHPGVRTSAPLLAQLADAVSRAVNEAGTAFDVVAVGSTGLTEADHDPGRLAPLLPGVRRVILAHDSATSYLGALGDRPGVVCAAGTGVVTLALGAAAMSRVDGWGYLMGDAGSAFWIGRAALTAAMRAHDGRGPATPLLDRLIERFGEPEGAYVRLQNDPQQVAAVASCAVWVTELAASDEAAAAICEAAGRELATSIAAAARNTGQDAPPVAYVGQVLAPGPIAVVTDAALAELLPGAIRVDAAGDGLAGALALPGLRPGHPLFGLVRAWQR